MGDGGVRGRCSHRGKTKGAHRDWPCAVRTGRDGRVRAVAENLREKRARGICADEAALLDTRGEKQTVLKDGGFVAGDTTRAAAEIHNPAAGTFTAVGSLHTGSSYQTTILLNTGKVLIAGGYNSSNAVIARAELYDPVAKTFALTGSLVTARQAGSASLLNNGTVLIAGGYGPSGVLASSELYDPASGTFSLAGNLNTARNNHSGTLLGDGTVLIAGGETVVNANAIVLSSAELYQPNASLSVPYSLQVTPAAANVAVGGTQQFTAVDNLGRPRSDATWTVSNSNVATITANSSPVLTGVAAGQVTLTANVDGVKAQAQVTVVAAGSLTPGSLLWSVPAISGFTPVQLAQAVPSNTGPDLYSIQSNSDGSQAWIQTFTTDGQQLAQTHMPAVNGNSVPDAFGGLLVAQYVGCDNTNFVRIADLDPATLRVVWQLTGQSTCAPIAPQMAIRQDGSIVVASNGNTAGFPELLILDGHTGQILAAPSIPTSTYIDLYGNTLSGFSPIGSPIVDSTGATYVEYEVRTVSAYQRLGNPATVSSVLWLLKIATDNTTTSTQLSSSSNMNLFPGSIIPDGNGGVLTTWTINWTGDTTIQPPTHPYQGADVSSPGGVVTYDMPMAPTQVANNQASGFPAYLQLVLGENGVAFVSYVSNIVSFSVASGSVNWNYQATPQNYLNIIASTVGNGLVAKTTNLNGLDTALSFDPTGSVTIATWTGSNISYWAGSYYPGSSPSGTTEYFGDIIQLSDSPMYEPSSAGTNQAAPRLIVGSPSNAGPNQTAISSVFGKIKSALDADANSSKPKCSTWLQGQGSTASQVIQSLLDNNTFGHGVFTIQIIAAVHGSRNLDGSPSGIPSNFTITVNDLGAFFQAKDLQGNSFYIGRRHYPGNTLRAQASILIHELAHTLPAPSFQEDNGKPKAGKANDKLVDGNCRYLIEGLQ
jgi:hypothetical protein